MWKCECAKGAINLALRDVYQSFAASSHDIDLFIRPNCPKVKHDWAAGEFMVAPATYRMERKDGPALIACGNFDLGGPSDEPLFSAPMFSGVIDAKGEPNKSP